MYIAGGLMSDNAVTVRKLVTRQINRFQKKWDLPVNPR